MKQNLLNIRHGSLVILSVISLTTFSSSANLIDGKATRQHQTNNPMPSIRSSCHCYRTATLTLQPLCIQLQKCSMSTNYNTGNTEKVCDLEVSDLNKYIFFGHRLFQSAQKNIKSSLCYQYVLDLYKLLNVWMNVCSSYKDLIWATWILLKLSPEA